MLSFNWVFVKGGKMNKKEKESMKIIGGAMLITGILILIIGGIMCFSIFFSLENFTNFTDLISRQEKIEKIIDTIVWLIFGILITIGGILFKKSPEKVWRLLNEN